MATQPQPTNNQSAANPYGVASPELPAAPTFDYGPGGPSGDTPYGGMEQLFAVLTQRLGMDEERARAVLDRYQQEYAQGKGIQDPLIARDQDIVSRGNLNPDDAGTYGEYAAEAQAAAQERDRILEQIRASGLQGGELKAAEAQAISDLGRKTAELRQGAVKDARDRLYGVAKDKTMGFSPGEDSGTGSAMLGYFGNRLNTETNAATQRYATDVNRDLNLSESQRRWLLETYGINVGAARDAAGQEIQRTANEQNYTIAKDRLALDKENTKKPGFLGGLLGTLGSLFGSGGSGNDMLSRLFNNNNGSTNYGDYNTLGWNESGGSSISPDGTQMNTGGYVTNLPPPSSSWNTPDTLQNNPNMAGQWGI